MDVIERVARALALADLDEETAMAVDLDAHMQHVSEHYEELARAAIKAMREPTEPMVDSCGNGDAAKWGRGCWANYIDAALAIRATPVSEREEG